jgi:transcriptional regulator with XRE-family HTH domain
MSAQESELPDDSQLGELIREQIRRRRMTHDELAAAIGVHRSTLSRWISGEVEPSPPHLSSLEEALGVQFVDDGDGRYHALDAAPAVDAPRVVVVVAGTAEAMEAALDRLGVPRAE